MKYIVCSSEREVARKEKRKPKNVEQCLKPETEHGIEKYPFFDRYTI